MRIEELSALGIVTAAVVYLIAFMAHSMEWAAARGLPVVGDDEPLTPEREKSLVRVDMYGRMGLGLTVVGFLAHLVGTVLRGVAAERFPWGNMYEFTISSLLFAVLVYLVLAFTKDMRWLGLPMSLLLAVGNGLAATVFYVAVAPLVPALHSVWFIIHIVAAAIAGAAFNVGGMAAIIYIFQHRAEQRGGERSGYLAKLPSAKAMDTFSYRMHAFAFPLWTFTIAAGSIWAEYAWGRFWGWDPKETWSLVTWVIYAMYLHARATAGWRGVAAAVIAIIGVVSFWFNFVGVNLVFSGLHSYAGI
ncbi:c-type cytochrome biogenesis protein CcsB [Luteococcus sp. OSA5]|uniref:c-type cytochrome biogenesis protein CcsB n=1 Tax=Luteococcus sp. OSA5 TaxID=3401630 RepID=UPI003B42FDD6